MYYTPTLLAIAAVSFLTSILIVVSVKWHGRFSLDHTDGIQKFHAQPTPRVGGIAIFAGLVAACLMSAGVQSDLLVPMVFASLPAFGVGLLEDITKRVGVVARLLATMGSGLFAYYITGIALNRADMPGLDFLLAYSPFAVLFTAFAVAGIANSVNIIDGFNGLSSGTVMIILAALGVIADHHGDVALVANCLLLGVAIFGFWIVNFPFGKLFLGDGGAYLVGFALAWLAVLLIVRNPGVSPWLVLLASAYPVIEVLYSVWRRRINRQPASAPDSSHMHSVFKREVIGPRLRDWPANLRNSAVSPLMWCFAATPAGLAVLLVSAPKWIVISALVMCVALYHFVYQFLSKDL